MRDHVVLTDDVCTRAWEHRARALDRAAYLATFLMLAALAFAVGCAFLWLVTL